METLCLIFSFLVDSIKYIICNEILQRIVRYRRLLVAVLFLGLELGAFVLEQIGENQFDFLLASSILSTASFIMTAYSATRSTTDVENDRIVIELAFSVVQLIITYLYLALSIFRVKIKSNITSIFPLVLAITTLTLSYKHHELAHDPRPNTTPGRDEEEGFAGPNHDVGPTNNLSDVNRDEMIADSRTFLPHAETSTVVHVPTCPQSPKADILGKSRASLNISSDNTMMADHEEITDSIPAPTISADTSSNVKLFSKHVSKTDLQKELIVPNEAMEYVLIPEGKEFVDLPMKDMKGDIWQFRLHNKPTFVLIEGWLEFVQSKGLVQDVTVTFYKQQNEDFEEPYRIEVDSIDTHTSDRLISIV